jgi:hypothetical protein
LADRKDEEIRKGRHVEAIRDAIQDN